MSTERIDHVAEAREMLGVAAITQDAEVVAHALLALVEQQRIANLIAVTQMESGPYKDANNWTREVHDADGRYISDEDANPYLRNEIREALGL